MSAAIPARRIAHLVPGYAVAHPGAGSWKACEAMGLLLARHAGEVRRVIFHDDEGADVRDEALEGATHAVVEYTRAAVLPRRLRRRPGLRVYSRAHNAEAFQFWSQTGPPYLRPRMIYGFLRLLLRDAGVCRASHRVLDISDWDRRHYWRWLAGSRAVWLPYVSPWPDLRRGEAPRPWPARDPLVVSLAGSRGRIGGAATDGLARLARAWPGLAGSWRFATSAGLMRDGLALPAGLEVTPDDEDPWSLMCRVRAIAVLTPHGFGLKTTVVDALAAGCHVLVHPRQATHLPEVVRRACLVVDPDAPGDGTAVARLLAAPPAPHGCQAALRRTADETLERVLREDG